MTFSSSTKSGDIPSSFLSYRLDSHLILNALNQLGMEVYTLTNREIPLVGLVADYIIAEHETGIATRVDALHTLALEWKLCKTLLMLKAFLGGVNVQFREMGDLSAAAVPDHALADIICPIFGAWPDLAGRQVLFILDAREPQSVRLESFMKKNAESSAHQPFAAELLASLRCAKSHAEFEIALTHDDGSAWGLLLNLDP